MPPLGVESLVMKACSLIAVLGLSLLASCADRNAVEACRELAGVRDKDGYLVVKGQELNDKVRAAMDKAAFSKSPLMRNEVNAVRQAKTNDEYIKAFDSMLAACSDFHPVVPVNRSRGRGPI